MLTEKELKKIIENNPEILTTNKDNKALANYIKESQNRSQKANTDTKQKDNKQIKNNKKDDKKNTLVKYLFTFILIILFIIQYILLVNIVYKYK